MVVATFPCVEHLPSDDTVEIFLWNTKLSTYLIGLHSMKQVSSAFHLLILLLFTAQRVESFT